MFRQTAARGCATTTAAVSSIRTSGTASASQGGEGWDAMWPLRRSAPTGRITREVGPPRRKDGGDEDEEEEGWYK